MAVACAPAKSILEASSPGEIESAIAALVHERASALVVSGGVFFLTQRDRLVELAAKHAIPTIYAYQEFVTAGGLMSYGGNLRDMYRQIGLYTGRILKGEKAANLPVEEVTKVELVMNLKTAKMLGIEIPLSTLVRVDGDPELIGYAFWAANHGLIMLHLANKLPRKPDFQTLRRATMQLLIQGARTAANTPVTDRNRLKHEEKS